MSRESIKDRLENFLIEIHNDLQDSYLEENGDYYKEEIILDGKNYVISNDPTSSSLDAAVEYADDELPDMLEEIAKEWRQHEITKKDKKTLGIIIDYSQRFKQQLNT